MSSFQINTKNNNGTNSQNIPESISQGSSTTGLDKVMRILFSKGYLLDERNQMATATNQESIQWKRWWNHSYTSEKEITLAEIKPFLFDETHQLIWYKNTNLPTITFSLQNVSTTPIINANINSNLVISNTLLSNNPEFKPNAAPSIQQAENMICTVVCISIDNFELLVSPSPTSSNQQEPHWKQHPLEGDGITQRLSIDSPTVVFQRIKCKETSYNLKQTPLGFSHPFMPEILSVNYERFSLTVNADTIDSFYEYYGSCSIRHKKAPDWGKLFVELQRSIYQFFVNKTKEIRRKLPVIALVVSLGNNSQKMKEPKKNQKKFQVKIEHFLKPLIREGVIELFQEKDDVPYQLTEIVFQERMRNDYKSKFSQLLELKKQAESILDSIKKPTEEESSEDVLHSSQHLKQPQSFDSETGYKNKEMKETKSCFENQRESQLKRKGEQHSFPTTESQQQQHLKKELTSPLPLQSQYSQKQSYLKSANQYSNEQNVYENGEDAIPRKKFQSDFTYLKIEEGDKISNKYLNYQSINDPPFRSNFEDGSSMNIYCKQEPGITVSSSTPTPTTMIIPSTIENRFIHPSQGMMVNKAIHPQQMPRMMQPQPIMMMMVMPPPGSAHPLVSQMQLPLQQQATPVPMVPSGAVFMPTMNQQPQLAPMQTPMNPSMFQMYPMQFLQVPQNSQQLGFQNMYYPQPIMFQQQQPTGFFTPPSKVHIHQQQQQQQPQQYLEKQSDSSQGNLEKQQQNDLHTKFQQPQEQQQQAYQIQQTQVSQQNLPQYQ